MTNLYANSIKVIFSLALLFTGSLSYAQPATFDWALRFGNVDDDKGNCIVTDASGNVYTIGNYNGTVDIDPGPNVVNLTPYGYTDFYISKWDAAGNLLWAASFGGSLHDNGTSIALDAAGNVYATGGFTNTTDFDPGPNTANLVSAGGLDIFVLKLDAAGNFGWVKQIGGTALAAIGGDEGKSIALDAAGNIYTLGRFEGSVDFDPGSGTFNLVSPGGFADVFACKLDAQGNFVWAKQWGAAGNNDWVNSIALDAAANVYSTGSFYSPIDFDPGAGSTVLSPGGLAGAYVSKLDSAGNFVWAKGFGKMGGFVQDLGALTVDNYNNVFLGGTFSGTVDFNPDAGSNNLMAGSGSNGFIVKLSSAGTYTWAKALGGPGEVAITGLTTDQYNNVYAAGWFSDFSPNTDFDPGNGTFILTSGGYWDAYVCKLNGSGNFAWAKGWGNVMEDQAQSVAIDASSNVYSTGYFNGTVDFDPGANVFNLTGAGSADAFIHKMEQTGNGVQEADAVNMFSVYPNPSNGNFMLSFTKIIQNGTADIIDPAGKNIFSADISGFAKTEIQLDDVAQGIYFVRISDGNNISVLKIILSGK